MQVLTAFLLVALLLFPRAGSSQSLTATGKQPQKTVEKNEPVPKAYLPPAGMCRIWVDNVPPARQPAPTDCATAIRNKPPNARVIFPPGRTRSEEHTSELQSRLHLVCRLLLEKKK